LTNGFIVRSMFSSTAISESKGKPVLLTPSRRRASAYPIAPHSSANTNGLETLWIENVVSTSPMPNDLPLTPATEMPNQSGEAPARTGM
jgi:hypothetical protein